MKKRGMGERASYFYDARHSFLRHSSGSIARPTTVGCFHALRGVCCALYHLTRVPQPSSVRACRFPPKTKNRHVRRKYIAHVGAVTKDVSTNERKGNFLHFSPGSTRGAGVRSVGRKGVEVFLKYRGNQSPARVAAIERYFPRFLRNARPK